MTTTNPQSPCAFTISVAGTPRPQPRPRRVRSGAFVSTVDPKVRLWRNAMERALRGVLSGRELPLFAGPVSVTLIFSFFRPSRGDADNYAKAAMDVMENVGVFANDRQVAELRVEKREGVTPGLIIQVEPFEKQAPLSPRPPKEDRPAWLL